MPNVIAIEEISDAHYQNNVRVQVESDHMSDNGYWGGWLRRIGNCLLAYNWDIRSTVI